ncbi:MAG: NADH-quinone oxidoreductase subunit H [Methanomicrobiales archaeon]|nr:NADH-quinone oxidoreductase subunit H [Methanomicrobiales archaeon]
MIEQLGGFLYVVLGTIFVALFGIGFGLGVLGVDRKLTAHMQARIGPPLRQPFIDIRKLLLKENIIPENAISWLFNAAPVFALAASVTILLYLPIGGLPPVLGVYGDIILIMYLLTVPALAMVTGGFASGSPYATVGAQREMITMMAYELPLATVFIALAWRLARAGVQDPFSLASLTSTPIWSVAGPLGIIGALILLIVLIFVTPGELSRVPFDTPEAETELAGGLMVEYSGKNLAMFYLAQGVKSVAMASVIVALFLPWGLSEFVPGIPALGILLDFLWYIVKVLAVLFVSVSLIRVAMARFRISQVVTMYWIYLGGLGILGLTLLFLDSLGGV